MTDKEINVDDVTLTDEERQPCEVWTRVMGYHRPISQYNIGKKQEQADRAHFLKPKREDAAND